jgi:hypothetical protein
VETYPDPLRALRVLRFLVLILTYPQIAGANEEKWNRKTRETRKCAFLATMDVA